MAQLARRLLNWRAATLLAKNTAVSILALAISLALMWVLVERASLAEMLAAGFSFLVSNSIHYAFGQAWIFRGTSRPVGQGYSFFLGNALVGLFITLVVFSLLLGLGLHYLWARVVASIFAGLAMFALNAVLNFRCL